VSILNQDYFFFLIFILTQIFSGAEIMHTYRLVVTVQSRDACIYFYLNIQLFEN